MDTGNAQNQKDGRLFPEDEPPITIEPIKPKRPSRTVREIEALLAGLQVALVEELHAVKLEVLHALRETQTSVETMAREMVKKAAGTDSADGNGSR